MGILFELGEVGTDFVGLLHEIWLISQLGDFRISPAEGDGVIEDFLQLLDLLHYAELTPNQSKPTYFELLSSCFVGLVGGYLGTSSGFGRCLDQPPRPVGKLEGPP